ncbi:hypothetical protein AXFE_02560 [Acidithrix ferrooxidans]|uniref:Uncharacterized protein n=1 Tax=Acidithrix ferrooxidans TaxID=1280514 RepID=A0A0D8HP19_9ACTN|nr:hypothetical protein AXFE_02560 [Acidithrix ferrooxidans]CAG4921705.1 unnamed protein product [Acidithrix sp. C25]
MMNPNSMSRKVRNILLEGQLQTPENAGGLTQRAVDKNMELGLEVN